VKSLYFKVLNGLLMGFLYKNSWVWVEF